MIFYLAIGLYFCHLCLLVAANRGVNSYAEVMKADGRLVADICLAIFLAISAVAWPVLLAIAIAIATTRKPKR